jgi:hypothetical protein
VDFQAATPLFLVLGAGTLLSIFVFVIEVIVHRYCAGYHKRLIHIKARSKLFTPANVQSARKVSVMHMIKKDTH